MLTKKQFIDMLKFMSKKNKQQDAFCGMLEDMSANSGYVTSFIYSEYEEKLLDLLRDNLDDIDDDISYFLYELGGIADIDTIIPNEKCPTFNDGILYNSAATLYDYLISKQKKL